MYELLPDEPCLICGKILPQDLFDTRGIWLMGIDPANPTQQVMLGVFCSDKCARAYEATTRPEPLRPSGDKVPQEVKTRPGYAGSY